MMKPSAGLLLFRRVNEELEVFLVHPGGPFWTKKDAGAWSIPKGEYSKEESALNAAKREFREETGLSVDGEFIPLGEVKQSRGKIVTAWALEQDLDPSLVRSNVFTMEYPPKSGVKREFPEVDKAAWFSLALAVKKMHPGQHEFLRRLTTHLERSSGASHYRPVKLEDMVGR